LINGKDNITMKIEQDELYRAAVEHLETSEPARWDAALQCLNLILLEKIDNFAPLFHMAVAFQKKGLFSIAITLLNESLQRNPKFCEGYNNLGVCYKTENMDDKAIPCFEKAIEIWKSDKRRQEKTPEDIVEYYANYASMYIVKGTPQKAIDIIDKGLKYNDSHPQSRWNRALAYLEKGDYDKGFKEYDWGMRSNRPDIKAKRSMGMFGDDRIDREYNDGKTPFWKGEKGKTVVVYGEQGIGDEIIFASVLPDMIKDCKVILDAHPRLADMFRRSFPEIPVYGTRKESYLPWQQFHKIDAKIPIGSCVQYYRKKAVDFPGTAFVIPDEKLVEKLQARLDALGDRPKIGFSWTGGTKGTASKQRTIPLDMWTKIFSLDADFISLQYKAEHQKDVDVLSEKIGKPLHHWQSVLDDYDLTAALVANLDFIISAPQSVVHLAGSIGTPGLQLCPKHGMWQIGAFGKDMPWHKSIKNIWQTVDGEWADALDETYDILSDVINNYDEAMEAQDVNK